MAVCAGLALCLAASAQPDRRDVRRGNRDFRKENYKEAEIGYRKALVKDTASFAANYNLANTLYRNGDMEQARRHLDTLKSQAPGARYASDYYYNSGNVAVGMKDWQAAVDSYMQSLLRNPGDLEAKENFIYAREMLRNQQQNGGSGQDNQDNKDNQDKNDGQDNQDNQNQDRNQDNQQDQNRNGQDNKDNQDRKDGQGQQDQPKISPQAAQQMLQAIQAKEKETQDKVNKEKANAMKARQKEKNW